MMTMKSTKDKCSVNSYAVVILNFDFGQ